MSPIIRRILLAVAIVLFLALAWTGLSGGVNQISQSPTLGEKTQTVMQLVYGVFALLGVLTTFVGRRWRRMVFVVWLASLTLAAGLAAVVWGGTSILIGVVSGAAALVIGAALDWLLRFGARGLHAPEPG